MKREGLNRMKDEEGRVAAVKDVLVVIARHWEEFWVKR